jgi:hypothetical protein
MKPKEPMDPLVELTMAFAKAVYPSEPNIGFSPASVSEVLAVKRARSAVEVPLSERDWIRERVADFKAHQERLRREREDYYTQTITKARKLARRSPQPLNGFSDE